MGSGGSIDIDRQARDERAHAAIAGDNHRAGDDEFHGIPHILLTVYSTKGILTV
jgi:hypothetical protein